MVDLTNGRQLSGQNHFDNAINNKQKGVKPGQKEKVKVTTKLNSKNKEKELSNDPFNLKDPSKLTSYQDHLKENKSFEFSIDVNIINGWDGLTLFVFYALFFISGYLIYYIGATYLNHDCMMAAVPFYFIFVLFELGMNSFYYPMKEAKYRERGETKTTPVVSEAGKYNMVDSVTSITSGILQTLFDILVFRHVIGLKPFVYLHENYSLWKFIHLPSLDTLLQPVKAWINENKNIILSTWGLKFVDYFSLTLQTFFYLFFIDLGYYFFHRVAHENKVFWVFGHEAHHSSERYNFSTALRQTFWQPLYTTFFYLFLAPFFDPKIFAYYKQWNTIFQFWVHTTSVRKCYPWIEYIFNTPSHHRVHHDRRVHANYAGMFIIWDRWLGTFIPEESERLYTFKAKKETKSKPGQNSTAKTPRNSRGQLENLNIDVKLSKKSTQIDVIQQDEYPIYGTPTPLYSFHPIIVQFNLVSQFFNRIYNDLISLLQEIIKFDSIESIRKCFQHLWKALFLGPGYRPKRYRKSNRGLNTFQAPPLDRKFRYLSCSEFLSTKLYHVILFITIIIQSIVLLIFWEKRYEDETDQCNDETLSQPMLLLYRNIFQRIKYLVLLNMASGMLIQGTLFDIKYSEFLRTLLEPLRLLAFCGIYSYNRFHLLNQLNSQKLLLLPLFRNQYTPPAAISMILFYLITIMDFILILNFVLILMISFDKKIPIEFKFYIRGKERKL